MGKLVIVTPGEILLDGVGAGYVPVKTMSGVKAFAERWDGETVWVTQARARESAVVGGAWRHISFGSLPYEVVITDRVCDAVANLGADVVHALLSVNYAKLCNVKAPVVFYVENPLRERLKQEYSKSPKRSAYPRIVAGGVRREAVLTGMVARSAGIQCNGWPAWKAYHRMSRSSILFLDSRLHDNQVWARNERATEGPLSLGFSGRFLAMKGPAYAVRLARELSTAGVECNLTLFGAGPLECELRAAAGANVRFAGELDFDTQWVPCVRSDIDIMVLPHVQGDPSGTYLESAGLGVPILGFDNSALRELVGRDGFGWVVPVTDSAALFAKAKLLSSDRAAIREASSRGVDFMIEHSFEREMDRRVEHLRSVVH